ncbi:hypothetical protein, partial [Yersinia mollaretii]|uniref:hypothetical protein n=1 Tax=Yersinia mollaretii TaxID=33060 RepID=UPI000CACC498
NYNAYFQSLLFGNDKSFLNNLKLYLGMVYTYALVFNVRFFNIGISSLCIDKHSYILVCIRVCISFSEIK